jgi:hypothetical protein
MACEHGNTGVDGCQFGCFHSESRTPAPYEDAILSQNKQPNIDAVQGICVNPEDCVVVQDQRDTLQASLNRIADERDRHLGSLVAIRLALGLNPHANEEEMKQAIVTKDHRISVLENTPQSSAVMYTTNIQLSRDSMLMILRKAGLVVPDDALFFDQGHGQFFDGLDDFIEISWSTDLDKDLCGCPTNTHLHRRNNLCRPKEK